MADEKLKTQKEILNQIKESDVFIETSVYAIKRAFHLEKEEAIKWITWTKNNTSFEKGYRYAFKEFFNITDKELEE